MKLVSNQLSPNFTFSDSLYALWCTIAPRLKAPDLTGHFETQNVRFASTARTLLGILAEIVPEGKKVGIPAVCCAVMATPFLSKNKDICWLDTDEHGLLDPTEVEKHKSELGMVIVPHIFGQKANLESVMTIAKQNNIIVVEDGAHFFEPGKPEADYRLLSFGREKDISCVSGGALIWNDNAPGKEGVQNYQLERPTRSWAVRHALQPLILSVSLPWWNKGGRFIAGFFAKSRVLPRAVSQNERKGREDFPQTELSIIQQKILVRSLKQHTHDLLHREQMSHIWKEKIEQLFPEAHISIPLNFFRVIVTGLDRSSFLKSVRPSGFDFGEWDGEPIAPRGVDLQQFQYRPGQCPRAEQFIKNYVTFPTNRRTTAVDIERFSQIFDTK